MATEGADTSRARVQTYVPAYQKEKWRRHAEDLDMSLSEFVRSMVQAGRKGFEPTERRPATGEGGEHHSSGPDPGGERLEERVLDILDEDGFTDWDDLVTALTDDVEDRLEETLQELQSSGRVRHSGRNGGYTLE